MARGSETECKEDLTQKKKREESEEMIVHRTKAQPPKEKTSLTKI